MKAKLLIVVLSLSVLFISVNEGYATPVGPTAYLTASPTYVFLGDSVTLNGSGSSPSKTSMDYYKWDFIYNSSYDYTESSSSYPDGAYDAKTKHTYTRTGTYTVELKVFNNGLPDYDTCTVYVVKIKNITTGIGYTTIQAAIDAAHAENAQTIKVIPGTYTENLDFDNKNITLTSIEPNNPYVVAATIIDGSGSSDTVVDFLSGDKSPTITGFTITGGSDTNGGGIDRDSVFGTATITNCIITGNAASTKGGGMYINNCDPVVTNCVFKDNSVSNGDGGGMYIESGDSPTVTNCFFVENGASADGGGMYTDGSSATVTSCVFSKNTANDDGGGVWNNGSSLTIKNCTFSCNSAGDYGGGMYNNGGNPTLTNCIFWSDTPDEIYVDSGTPVVTYSCIQDADPDQLPIPFGGGSPNWNIDDDPEFKDEGASPDPAGPDGVFGTYDDGLRLRIKNGPCTDVAYDTADPVTDITSHGRIDIADVGNQGCAADIGAYEFPGMWFVDLNAGGSDNGSSWANAFDTINEAVDAAGDDDEIWVADGNYILTSQLTIDKGLKIYGGFEGNSRDPEGETDRSQRDWETNIAIVNGNDTVRCFYVNANCTIDGLTITKGWGGMRVYYCQPNVSNCTFSKNNGTGLYAESSNCTVSNCTFSENAYGGGMYNDECSPTVNDCNFIANIGGGMVNMDVDYKGVNGTSPVVTNCIFKNNLSGQGGGMANYFLTHPTVTNCLFIGNTAYFNGGGGIANVSQATEGPVVQLKITNCTFIGNGTGSFGALIDGCDGGGPADNMQTTATNCIFWGNTAWRNESGGLYYGQAGSSACCDCPYDPIREDETILQMLYCCYQGGGYSCCVVPNPVIDNPEFVNMFDFADYTHWDPGDQAVHFTEYTFVLAPSYVPDVEHSVDDVIEYNNDGVARTITSIDGIGETNYLKITVDPGLASGKFLHNRLIYNWGPGVTDVDEDWHLTSDSPCIDVGDDGEEADYTGQKDLDGDERVIDVVGPGDGTKDVDIGVDEYDPS